MLAEIRDLKNIRLFSPLSEEALEKLASVSSRVRFEDGQVFMCQGDGNTPVYFILAGKVRVFRCNPEGREQTLSVFGVGDGFNIPTAFAEMHAPANAEAIGNVELLRIGAQDFNNVVSETPEIARLVLRDLSDRLFYLADLVHDVSLRSVRARLARFLLLQVKASSQVSVGWTKEQIAAQIGTSREVVSRALRSLVDEGILRTERHKIIIADAPALEAAIDS